MPNPSPKHVVIIGAGMVGLSVAWFLQEYGVNVTVFDRKGVAAGSSWGNAGWISPGLATPLPEASVLRYGIKSLLRADAPLYIPPAFDVSLVNFLVKFARRCNDRDWRRAMDAYIPLNNAAIDAFDVLHLVNSTLEVKKAPIMAAFRRRDDAKNLLEELEMINRAGQPVKTEMLGGEELRASIPQLSSVVDFGIRIDGQRYIDPGYFTTQLGTLVESRGATIETNKDVVSITREGGVVAIRTADGDQISGDAAVVAVGAWMDKLAKPLGVKMSVKAGRGYSFLLPTTEAVPSPIYFPAIRVACTPIGVNSLRVAGTMEFRKPDAKLDPARIASIVRSSTPLLTGVDWNLKSNEWVGPRPVTADGMPLIGESRVRGVFIAGGHGMWGITLGPATGKLLASQIVTGDVPEEFRPFNPTR